MSWASVNGSRVVSGSLTIPAYGAWTADLVLDGQTTLAAPLAVMVGSLSLTGSPFRQTASAGATRVRAVAGAGGWRMPVASQAYQNPAGILSSLVLGDVAQAVGEVVAVTSPVSLGTAFVRQADIAARILRQIAGITWWIDALGVTQVGLARPSSFITSAAEVVKYHDDLPRRLEIATESPADWMPGNTFATRIDPTVNTIAAVTHRMTNDGASRLDVLVA